MNYWEVLNQIRIAFASCVEQFTPCNFMLQIFFSLHHIHDLFYQIAQEETLPWLLTAHLVIVGQTVVYVKVMKLLMTMLKIVYLLAILVLSKFLLNSINNNNNTGIAKFGINLSFLTKRRQIYLIHC